MVSLAVVVGQILACLGYGAVALHACGLSAALALRERLAWSFAAGFGILGWILFFVGWLGLFRIDTLALVLLIGLLGLILIPWGAIEFDLGVHPTKIDWALGITLIFVAFGDVLEALAPPADADTLAYHFALPKQFIAAGHLEFVPRAIDGAIPLLIQMTYVPALALGGEQALTLWCMASGWMAALTLFVIMLRYVAPRIAFATGVMLMTTPAVLAGAGTGQIETRIVIFTVIGSIAVADYVRHGSVRLALFGGVMAGFYAASKFTGLFFAFALVLGIVIWRPRLDSLVAFSAGTCLAGFQWYLWNWLHAADPIFPMLTGHFGFGDSSIWPPDYDQWYRTMAMAGESPVARNVLWFFAFPVYETFVGFAEFGGGRVGLGPFIALIFPFAFIAAWLQRQRLAMHPLSVLALTAFLFYALWFFISPSLRVRHLLPVYPLLLIVVIVAAERFIRRFNAPGILTTAFTIAILIQCGGQALYIENYARFFFSHEDRLDFLARNVPQFTPVPWINTHLTERDRIFTDIRQLAYLIDVPSFVGHLYDDPRIDLRPDKQSPDVLMASLHRYKITHVLARERPDGAVTGAPEAPWDALWRGGCLSLLQRFSTTHIESRTMDISEPGAPVGIYRVQDCRLS